MSTTILDWRSREHVGPVAACRYCGASTFLRDEFAHPAHKVCAEAQRDAEPCTECGIPTQRRDNIGEPCHLACDEAGGGA